MLDSVGPGSSTACQGVRLFSFYRIAIAMSLWKWDKAPYARLSTRRPMTSKSARGETDSSKTQVMTYPGYAWILKYSPPTIYHGQGLASGSHTGPW